MKSHCKWIAAAAFAGCFSLYAQTGANFANEAKQAYEHIQQNILKAAQEMREEDYSFQPTPEIRTFGQLVAHIAEAQAHYCSMAEGSHTQFNASSRTTKADLIAALEESNKTCDAAYSNLNDSNMSTTVGSGARSHSKLALLYGNIAHDNEEYGYMAVYLRLKNQTPPSSQGHGMPARH